LRKSSSIFAQKRSSEFTLTAAKGALFAAGRKAFCLE
jgi:hypothetical protein